MEKKWIKTYRIYHVSIDGLLKIPKTFDGDYIFDTWYDTEELAIAAIVLHDRASGLVIIPSVELVYE